MMEHQELRRRLMKAFSILDELEDLDLRDANGRCRICGSFIVARHIFTSHDSDCLVRLAHEFVSGEDLVGADHWMRWDWENFRREFLVVNNADRRAIVSEREAVLRSGAADGG